MKMEDRHWRIYSVGHNDAFVVAEHGTLGMMWPTIIFDEKTGKRFRFESNEPLPEILQGRWSGYARYSEIPEDEGI